MISLNSEIESVTYFCAVENFMRGDYAACIDDFFKLSFSGDARASLYVAEILNRGGDGISRDEIKARDYYRKSLRQSYLPGAALGLALMNYRGQGGPVDISEAKRYFHMLRGNAFSLIMLGVISIKENESNKDRRDALFFFDEAWALGHPLGLKNSSIIRFHNGQRVLAIYDFIRSFILIFWNYGVKGLPIVRSPRDRGEILL